MPVETSGNYFIGFGNWASGYFIADRVGTMQITFDDNGSTPVYVKFYMRRIAGGRMLNGACIEVVKCADS